MLKREICFQERRKLRSFLPHGLILLFFLLGDDVILLVRGAMVSTATDYIAFDDASWAIHSTNLSSVLGVEKQSLYDKFMSDCNRAIAEQRKKAGTSNNDQNIDDFVTEDGINVKRPNTGGEEKLCDALEKRRMDMNRHQPRSVYNFTATGFVKVPVPAPLLQSLQNFYFSNKDRASQPEWTNFNNYQNSWESPSTIVRIEDESLAGGGQELQAKIWEEAKPILEDWIGGDTPLEPVSLYGIRQYHRGSILAPHVDRMPLVTSAISKCKEV